MTDKQKLTEIKSHLALAVQILESVCNEAGIDIDPAGGTDDQMNDTTPEPEARYGTRDAEGNYHPVPTPTTPKPQKNRSHGHCKNYQRASVIKIKNKRTGEPLYLANVREADSAITCLGRYQERTEADAVCATYLQTGQKPPPSKRGPQGPWSTPGNERKRPATPRSAYQTGHDTRKGADEAPARSGMTHQQREERLEQLKAAWRRTG